MESQETNLKKMASHHRTLDWRHFAATWRDGLLNRRKFSRVQTYLMFIGYPRSGHTLAGALLTAHRNMVISHELHALNYYKLGYRRGQLFHMLYERDKQFARRKCTNGKYQYTVPNQWQGRSEELTVIGDKKGGGSTKLLSQHPEMLSRFQKMIRVPVRIVHILRNPYDTITRIQLMAGCTLDDAIQRYFRLVRGTNRIMCHNPELVLTLSHESIIANPQQQLSKIGKFAGVEMDDDYLDDCASVVFKSPHLTRHQIDWSPESILRVRQHIGEYSFLRGYEFDEASDRKSAA